jgi:hypothetical protein
MNLNNTLLTKIFTTTCAIVLMVSFVLPASIVRADEDDDNNKNKKEQAEAKTEDRKEDKKSEDKDEDTPRGRSAIDRFIQSQTAAIDALIRAEISTAASSTPQTASTTATTITPTLEERSNVHEADTTTDLEDVLNETLEPEKPIAENNPKVIETPAKKPVDNSKSNDSDTNASTTPVIGSTDPTDLGTPSTGETAIIGQNSFLPSNYYIPFDNLSPEMTYALSFIALISGLSGAFLIVREPRTKEGWEPAPAFTREPLLEP